MSTQRAEYADSSYSSDPSSARGKVCHPRREKSKRPQLSCNDCRTRKVKCDRLQPCTACSLHQIADSCHYELTEEERHPILQAEAIKLKDKEIARLRQENQRLQAQFVKPCIFGNFDPLGLEKRKPEVALEDLNISGKPLHKRFRRGANPTDLQCQLPHPSPVTNEIAGWPIEPESPSSRHRTAIICDPSIAQMDSTSHPFPTLWKSQPISCLIDVLPNEDEILTLLDTFEHYAPLGMFPCMPEECSRVKVQQFLGKVEYNSEVQPDMLALLFATLAQGVQCGLYDRCGSNWIPGAMQTVVYQGNYFLAAAMHALRTASYMSRPTLLVIETLLVMGPYLTNAGKFLDAWSLFGMTVRLAQGIGLHRDPNQQTQIIPAAEVAVREKLWWWMLYMDQQYSVILGQPLAISSMGDCPSPVPLIQTQTVYGIEVYSVHFTTLIREILSAGFLSNDRIDKYTDLILELQDRLPDTLKFDVSWLEDGTVLPVWPFHVQAASAYSEMHNFLVLLHLQRGAPIGVDGVDNSLDTLERPISTQLGNCLRGRERVLQSCRLILQVLRFFQTRVRAALICWTVSQQAFNAAWVLLISMTETNDTKDLGMIKYAYSVFTEMSRLGIHNLANTAVDRLGAFLKSMSMGTAIATPPMRKYGMELLEDPASQGFLPGTILPLPFHVFESTPKPGEALAVGTLGLGKQTVKPQSVKPKKQKIADCKVGTKSKLSDKRSTVKQRRSSIPQRRYSGLRMKDDQTWQTGIEATKSSMSRPSGPFDTTMRMESSEMVNPWSQCTTLASLVGPLATRQLGPRGDPTTLQTQSPLPIRGKPCLEPLRHTWTPYPIYTASQNYALTDENFPKTLRSHSGSVSEHSSDSLSLSQTSTQISSPLQTQTTMIATLPPGSPQSHFFPPNVYANSTFGLTSLQGQVGPLAAAAVSTISPTRDTQMYSWQMQYPGLDNLS